MTTLRNLMDVLSAHSHRLPHMLDRPMEVRIGDSVSELGQCLVGVDIDRSVLYLTLPSEAKSSPEVKEPPKASDEVTLSTMRGPMKVTKSQV